MITYGIHDEQSDMRAHVCIAAQHVYVFPTQHGRMSAIDAQQRGQTEITARQPGTDEPTAKGYLIAPESIGRCQWFKIPEMILSSADFAVRADMPTEIKGRNCERIVWWMLHRAVIPLTVCCGGMRLVRDEALQIAGVDLQLQIDWQVKCDYNGGHKCFGGTGNLFIQTQESNPFNRR